MDLKALFKSLFNRDDLEDEDLEEELEEDEEDDFPVFNQGMPVEVMKNFDTVLFAGRLCSVGSTELLIERIPGEMSLPIQDVGNEVFVRGYDAKMNPIILEGRIIRSTVLECVVGELNISNYANHRKDIRFPMSVSGDIYTPEDIDLAHPQHCQIINISTGGACIMSKSDYAMGQMLRLRAELVPKGGYASYPCQVVRIIPRGGEGVEYGLLFAQLDRRKINDLLRDIQIIQRNTEQKILS